MPVFYDLRRVGHCLALLLALAFGSRLLAAESVFVSARTAVIFDSASASGKHLGFVKQNQELIIAAREGDWVKVATADASLRGFVSKLFVSPTKVAGAVGLSAGEGNLAAVAVRTRASAYITTAAATRGLAADNARARENLSFSAYDLEVSKWLETFVLTEAQVAEFATREGLVP